MKLRKRIEMAIGQFLASKGSRNVDVFTAMPCIEELLKHELLIAADIAHCDECLACFDSGEKLEGCQVTTEIERLISNRTEV